MRDIRWRWCGFTRGSRVFIQHAVGKKRPLSCIGIKLLNNSVLVVPVTGLQVHSTNCIPTLLVEDVINYLRTD